MIPFIKKNLLEVKKGGFNIALKKITLLILKISILPMYLVSLIIVILIRALRPFLVIRFSGMISSRIGHLAAETEQYLCERDARINQPKEIYIDIFYLAQRPICNKHLVKMWKRELRIWPSFIIKPIHKVNQFLPGGKIHEIGRNTQHDRDVHNLLDQSTPHLKFNNKELTKGKFFLRSIGISDEQKFICLNVRDSSYLQSHIEDGDFNYHNYRDSDIDNYILAAEALAEKGYYVLRMGVKVHKKIQTSHPRIYDYASSNMRTDFLDIYLAAKCTFCISTGSGFDNVVSIMRRPIVFVNIVPVAYSALFCDRYILIPKHHFSTKYNRKLTLSEIFSQGVAYCMTSDCYRKSNVEVIENSSDEILEACLEMVMRLENSWKDKPEDILNQNRFRDIFPNESLDLFEKKPLHGKIKSRISSIFLRNNSEWLN